MVSLEKRVASAILRSMRSGRAKQSSVNVLQRSSPFPLARLRQARFSDFDEVMELREMAGWSGDTRENWDRLWRRNPAFAHLESEPCMGWVLEAQGRVVAYLGNIPLIYHYGERTLIASTGSGLVAEPAYRAMTVSLNAAFYAQKGVDLFLSTTAIEAVGKIARAFKCLPLPQPEYDSMLFWVLQPEPFAEAVMKKLELNSSLSRIASMCASLAVRADTLVRRRWPERYKSDFQMRDIRVAEIGDDFGVFWMDKLKERPRLLADRAPATLRWHFDIPGDRGSSQVLCCYDQDRLLGYAVVRHEAAGSETGLRRSIIADMLAKDEDPDVLKALWIGAYDHAKQAGSHIFEVLGFPTSVRQVCLPWHPYLRKYPACPFYYKAADPTLHTALSEGTAWYASPFDGDTTLWGFGSA
jgi:hypothetical protein